MAASRRCSAIIALTCASPPCGPESSSVTGRSIKSATRRRQPARVRLSGGLSHAPFVRQPVADVFARVAIVTDQPEASAYGAAMMAGIAAGMLADEHAVAASLRALHVHAPDPGAAAGYARAFARYLSVVDANLPLYAGQRTT